MCSDSSVLAFPNARPETFRWPYTTPDGTRHVQREAVEIKTWRPSKPNPLRSGLKQLDGYLDRLRLETTTLAIFDQRLSEPFPATICEVG